MSSHLIAGRLLPFVSSRALAGSSLIAWGRIDSSIYRRRHFVTDRNSVVAIDRSTKAGVQLREPVDLVIWHIKSRSAEQCPDHLLFTDCATAYVVHVSTLRRRPLRATARPVYASNRTE